MAVLFYNIFLILFRAGIRISSLWSSKARLWINGRKKIFDQISSAIRSKPGDLVWIHCSSLGEFEQGRPVLEKIKLQFPETRILLTFFSSSGYEIRKNYDKADWVFYLPMDSPAHAKKFLDITNPRFVIFVKYDYWYYYLTVCKKRNIPLLLISAIFRKHQTFFKWYGHLHRKMLTCFTHLFVQDKESVLLLESIGITNKAMVSGDTRFDRVAEIASNFQPVDFIEGFCGKDDVLIAGSTWPEDERIIQQATAEISQFKLIIAPHEIHPDHLKRTKQLFPQSIFYSELKFNNQQPFHSKAPAGGPGTGNCLIIDNIGMLSRLYHYGSMSYVGGGFGKGIHNTLEAAVHGKPVFFGPHFKIYKEAVDLVNNGGGICIHNSAELLSWLKKLLKDREELEHRCRLSADFVNQNKGATEKIMNYIAENRLLTS